MAERVTLQTIADALGVSRTTVSNAYNRPDQLAPGLREKVLETARGLGYAGPDPAARRLRSGLRGAIGLMFSERLSYAFTDPGAVGFLQGLTEATEAKGYELLLLPGMRGERREIVSVRDAVVGAFCLYCMPEGHPAVAAAHDRRLPVVIVDEPRSPGSFFVGIDDREGARVAAAHVAGLGHERVAIVADRLVDDHGEGLVGPERIARSNCKVSRDRVEGYIAGVNGADPVPIYEALGNFPECGRRAAAELLALPQNPTAILCSTDVLALGVIDALHARGIDVPGDISVTGFDDVPAAATAGLTTIRQPLVEKGREAGRLLMEPGTEREVILPIELVERASTAPAPA
ncbi:MAG TPA: LacI family DNA-binding transcriptional regulator [Solirubrobacteraceae bacterium]|nr:LacI family DNA-binding transcriptional regulator [Solirubrobacteraceae bacterium]